MSQLELIYSQKDLITPKLGIKSMWMNLIRSVMPLSVLILFYTITEPYFIHVDFINPIFIFLSLSFLVNAIRLLVLENYKYINQINFLSYFVDALMIASTISLAASKGSVFSVFFFVLIFIAGLEYKKDGALFAAFSCAIAFNFMMFSSSSPNYLLAILGNNISFFLVGVLSGYLGEQVQLLDDRVQTQKVHINELKDINKLIVNNISSGLVVIDKVSVVSYANAASLQILNLESLEGRSLKEFLNGFMVKLGSLNFQKENIEKFELEYIVSQSDKRIIEFISSPFGSSFEKSGYILLLQDLTKTKRLELAMRQKEKLAAVGQLAAGIAHEIRNPLASISGSIQLMDQSAHQTVEDKKLMSIVLKETDRLNGLISEFLDFVKPDMPDKSPLNINELLEEVFEILRLNKGLRKDVHQEARLESRVLISGDYSKLKQAFLNIFINAYQAMEKSDQARCEIITYDDKDRVVVKIKDTGSGIDSEVKKHIFEPFRTTKSKGTGLGLAITHKIIENHGARIFVESEIGKGTEFTIEFIGDPYNPSVELRKLA